MDQFRVQYIIKRMNLINSFVKLLQEKVMHSTILSQERNNTLIIEEIISICKIACLNLKQNSGYKPSHTFFVSQAYAFFQDLIHLHSQEVNNFIRNILKKFMQMGQQNTIGQVNFNGIMDDMNQYSKWKKLQKNAVFFKLQKLLKYFLIQQCHGKNKLQIQNVQLQIQCSLNYTCPKCIKVSCNNGPKSLKFIEKNIFTSEDNDFRQVRTMKQITKDETKQNIDISFSHQKRKIENKLGATSRQKVHDAQIKQDNKFLNKLWKAYGKLMDLQKGKFIQNKTQQAQNIKIQHLYQQIYMRNIYNQKIINSFYNKVHKKEKKLFNRSLSIKRNNLDVEEDRHKSLIVYDMQHRRKAKSLKRLIKNDHKQNTQKLQINEYNNNIKPIDNMLQSRQNDKINHKLNLFSQDEILPPKTIQKNTPTMELQPLCLNQKKKRLMRQEPQRHHYSIRTNRISFGTKARQLPNCFEALITKQKLSFLAN